MTRPDFAHVDLSRLTDADLRYIVENFPEHGRSYEEMARIVHRDQRAKSSRREI